MSNKEPGYSKDELLNLLNFWNSWNFLNGKRSLTSNL